MLFEEVTIDFWDTKKLRTANNLIVIYSISVLYSTYYINNCNKLSWPGSRMSLSRTNETNEHDEDNTSLDEVKLTLPLFYIKPFKLNLEALLFRKSHKVYPNANPENERNKILFANDIWLMVFNFLEVPSLVKLIIVSRKLAILGDIDSVVIRLGREEKAKKEEPIKKILQDHQLALNSLRPINNLTIAIAHPYSEIFSTKKTSKYNDYSDNTFDRLSLNLFKSSIDNIPTTHKYFKIFSTEKTEIYNDEPLGQGFVMRN